MVSPTPDPPPEVSETEKLPASRMLNLLLAAGVLVAVVVAIIFSGQQPSAPLGVGSSAPEFQLPNVAGGEGALSDYRGQVILLNFWATWCKPCKDEMPSMERLYKLLKPEGFELLAVSVDEDAEPVVAFRDRFKLTFPIFLDAENEVSNRYQTFRFPETLLIDRNGKIIARFVGPRDWSDPMYVERIRESLNSGRE